MENDPELEYRNKLVRIIGEKITDEKILRSFRNMTHTVITKFGIGQIVQHIHNSNGVDDQYIKFMVIEIKIDLFGAIGRDYACNIIYGCRPIVTEHGKHIIPGKETHQFHEKELEEIKEA